MKSVHNDFEDNLILAAARRADVDFLVTEDKKLIVHANVVAKNIEDMNNYFNFMQESSI